MHVISMTAQVVMGLRTCHPPACQRGACLNSDSARAGTPGISAHKHAFSWYTGLGGAAALLRPFLGPVRTTLLIEHTDFVPVSELVACDVS